jgi:hypothetical protein
MLPAETDNQAFLGSAYDRDSGCNAPALDMQGRHFREDELDHVHGNAARAFKRSLFVALVRVRPRRSAAKTAVSLWTLEN